MRPDKSITMVSFLHAFPFFNELNDFFQVVHFGLAGEVQRFAQFVAIFQRLVVEPGDIELVAALLDFTDVEATQSPQFSAIGPFA